MEFLGLPKSSSSSISAFFFFWLSANGSSAFRISSSELNTDRLCKRCSKKGSSNKTYRSHPQKKRKISAKFYHLSSFFTQNAFHEVFLLFLFITHRNKKRQSVNTDISDTQIFPLITFEKGISHNDFPHLFIKFLMGKMLPTVT